MKNFTIIYTTVLLACLGIVSPSRAAIIDANDEWGITLDSGQSITGIAHFVWSSIEFTGPPVQIWGKYPDYENGGLWEDIGWQAGMSPDNKIVYMYGPPVTNNTIQNNLGWFAYTLFYQWDDEIVEPNFPIYIDTAIYNGPPGSDPVDVWGWRGTATVPTSWEYRAVPYAVDQPGYTEDFFDNPVPEPVTICLLGLGAVLLRKRRSSV